MPEKAGSRVVRPRKGVDLVVDELNVGVATRIDEYGGSQQVEFFGPHRDKMFGSLHRPHREAEAGIVICPAIHSDFERNYRRDVLLARELCLRGYAVQRFHYRGLGNSDGDLADATFDTMRDDTMAAAERLQLVAGVSSIAFAGTRWGALIAAAAAVSFDGAPLVLWEPPVDGVRYFAEASRARLIREVKEGRSSDASGFLTDEIRRTGRVDILGYAIDLPLYESTVGHTLDEEVGDTIRPILLVQMGAKRGLRTEYRALATRWERRGLRVETQAIQGEETWWFVGGFWEAVESRTSTKQLMEVTAAWLTRSMPQEAAT